jgi:DNA-binding LacI/PurR family transcriptional regulator
MQRRAGYLAALREAGIEPDPAWQIECAFTRDGGREGVEALLAASNRRRRCSSTTTSPAAVRFARWSNAACASVTTCR